MRVLMSGGGTGGHVNPAIAIANIIKQNCPDSVIEFVGTKRGIEHKLVPHAGYKLHHIEIQGIRRSLSPSNIKTAFLAAKSFGDCKKIIKKFKPDVVIGTGGYACWPVVAAASNLKIPTVLHESNATPGFAIKMLEKKATKVFVNFEETIPQLKHPEKAVRVGNPLRGDFSTVSRESARAHQGITGKYRYMILSVGGSMGAERINQEVIDMMKTYTSRHPEILHIHGTGAIEYEETKRMFHDAGLDKYPNLQLLEYIYDMPEKMAAADIVINRAGAMTLSEIAVLGRASVLIPSPNVTNNHQFKNADVLRKADACILIEEKELCDHALAMAVESLIGDGEKRSMMEKNVEQFAVKDAAQRIYEYIKETVK
ncbi:MAG: undecaprenyldiphospho-muramoylpentapeptide beta-N-acetylglucosaminyltransferase [Clostridia bacterium]|nr:undecaprenyldiphospho-muramoylpentapeptide beta-N-acetylglucosaminyltransferase [Clostridia bacterium]